MTRVIVRFRTSGTRNGEPWPAVGESWTLPDGEAADYILSGFVVLDETVTARTVPETATVEPTTERATVRRPAQKG